MAPARSHHAGMRAWPLLLVVIALLPAGSGPRAAAGDITIYRCVDAKGVVAIQDKPCGKDQAQSMREMTRPTDAPPRPTTAAQPVAPPPPQPPPQWEYEPEREPPPPMYVCTSYDGVVRESEVYDPNPRCEPLVLYYPDPHALSRQAQRSCQWVEDSCVRVSDAEACDRWHAKRKNAASNLLHSNSTDEPYHRSELQRIEQIIHDHC